MAPEQTNFLEIQAIQCGHPAVRDPEAAGQIQALQIDELAVRVNDSDACAAHIFYGSVPEPVEADQLFQCEEVTNSPWTSGYTITQPEGEYYTEPTNSDPASGDSGDVLLIQSATFQLAQ